MERKIGEFLSQNLNKMSEKNNTVNLRKKGQKDFSHLRKQQHRHNKTQHKI